MTQQSHYWAYTLRKSELKKTHVSQCSLQQYLQQLGHGSNLDVHWQVHIDFLNSLDKGNLDVQTV